MRKKTLKSSNPRSKTERTEAGEALANARPGTLAHVYGAARSDGWQNILTGIGVAQRDKRLAAKFAADRLSREELEEMWRGDDIAGRIVETVPEEMMREGYEVRIQPEAETAVAGSGVAPVGFATRGEAGASQTAPAGSRQDAFASASLRSPLPARPPGEIKRVESDSREQSEATHAYLEDREANDKLLDALKYERAFGGSAIFVGADDGQDPIMPLAEDRIRTIKFLTVLSAFELVPVSYYDNPQEPKYGEPKIFRIMPRTFLGPTSSLVEVHESRLIRFTGIRTSREQILNNVAPGWGDSVLVRCNRVLADFHLSWGSAAVLLSDFAQAVFKIKDLAQLVAADRDGVVVKRAQLIDLMRSTVRGVLLDADEEFERKSTPVTGLDALLQQLSLRLAAAADMPVTLLMGQAPAGLNATGESDIRFFYDRIRAKQNSRLRKGIERLVKLVFLAKDGPTNGREPDNWTVEFRPLWQSSEKEQAEIRKIQAETDKIYIDAGVVTPEEIAASRFGGDRYNTETTIDFEERAAAAAAYEEQKAKLLEKSAAAPAAEENPPDA